MKYRIYLALAFLVFKLPCIAQNGKITGRVLNEKNNDPVPFVNVQLWGTTTGTTSDQDGKFEIGGLTPGYIKLQASSVGYEMTVTEDLFITNAKPVYIEITLKEKSIQLREVVVGAAAFKKTMESPVSMRTISLAEIEKIPGANRDIVKVLQSFPGVASPSAFRNDIIIRGGGTSENRFFLDGIEIPTINHFSTQGASGGSVSIVNADFIREVEFYSGAFPAKRGNALSSVIEFSQKDGNSSKVKYRATIGASDLAITSDGPVGKNTTFVFSIRRSYLQFLFSALKLPFLPTYNDVQFKVRIKFDGKHELTLIGLGALDDSKLNTGIKNPNETQQYILGYLPVYKQWNYTVGLNYKHFKKNGFETFVASRNMLNNVSYKYKNNDESNPANKLLDYKSTESENKIRYENNVEKNDFKISFGLGGEYAEYNNKTFQRVFISGNPLDIHYISYLDLFKYGAFAQAGRNFINDRLSLSLGMRMDGNTYSSAMANPLSQLSPRFSLSYNLSGRFYLNFNTGRYYQLPPYTTLGYRDSLGILVNKINNISYIYADHVVLGIEYQRSEKSKITLEGFYKLYNHYPFSVRDSVSLANKGADFGSFGDEEVKSVSRGRAYGLELLFQEVNFRDLQFILSYTFVRSEFQDIKGKYIPSVWDNRHLLNLTARKSFKKNWDVGIKWRLVGGGPYTPYDLEKSSLRSAWDATGRAYLDFASYNSKRLPVYHQLDIRIDKGYFFNNWSLMLYIDIQNVYASKTTGPDFYVNYDANGKVVIDPNDPSRYILRPIKDVSGTVLPSVGVMFEF